jgi:adenosylcobyric acid synthase
VLSKRASALMIQGTSSSVGKSVIAAALCRILAQNGVNVAPFKAQNMSNNSYVTADGGEMGRAQVVQAQAAGVEPHTDMNPVLLKPEADSRSQVVINGKAVGSFEAQKYWGDQTEVWTAVTDAYDRLASQYDVIVLEGAGSPAEVNLRDRDIVNMKMAAYANASVILVGDIDRGGVFASLLGTMELLLPEERALVKATLINRFRGDMALLDPLPEMIAERTGVPVLGVVPFVYDLQVKDEDGVTFGDYDPPINSDALDVAVLGLPRVSNHDDLDPFRRAGCRIRIVTNPQELATAHIVIIPGSKSTIADLRWMKSRGLDQAVIEAAHRNITIVGICGGYQILGQQLDDPDATESPEPQSEAGLGLLPTSTVFDTVKTTRRVNIEIPAHKTGPLKGNSATGTGYEIHTGITIGAPSTLSMLTDDTPNDTSHNQPQRHPEPSNKGTPANISITATTGSSSQAGRELEGGPHRPTTNSETSVSNSWPDGTISPSAPVIGSYVHGLFDSPEILRRLLTTTAQTHNLPTPVVTEFSMDAEYDRLAAAVRESIDMNLINELFS